MASRPAPRRGAPSPHRGALAETITAFQERFPGAADEGDPEARRRAQIMAVTLEIAAAQGVKGATLRTIAARTRMRTASLYSYFPGGKDELVSTALADGLSGFYREVAAALRADEDAQENLRRLVFAHTRWTLANPLIAPAILVLERAHAISPVMNDVTARPIRQLHHDYRQLLGVVLGELGIGGRDAARLADLLVVICDNADTWGNCRGDPRADAEAQEFAWLAVRRLAGLT